ncbi:TetR/AcrR family transcriptional regulator [Poseidonocella sp. HB161398]|uniref:TetR/AcrR family transcriptional regulator n=1 Tax=Poseidonocella sp. HB161398 TaxID=2320855 RepID=UPI0011097A7F|nr:TetR/AcrR family transcriptional regulator [Poseidonocella sp. HB161398]
MLTDQEKAPAKRAGWKRDPVKVQKDILQAATREFADNGYNGGRIERIVQLTETSKRMIYYYFGDKEGLWRAVLEEAYTSIRAQETELDLADLPPLEALRKLFVFTFDHHRRNADFIRLVMIENIRGGHVLAASTKIRDLNRPVVAMLEDICRRGAEDGTLRPDLCPLQLHWELSALSFFNMSNRATFAGIFGAGLHDEAGQIRLRDSLAEQVLRAVRA